MIEQFSSLASIMLFMAASSSGISPSSSSGGEPRSWSRLVDTHLGH